MNTDIYSKELIQYVEAHSSEESDYLYQLRRETYLKTLAPQMVSGHLQGRMLSMISHMIKPQYIVEIGTFTGYATLCLAEGMPDNGKLITIEANPELSFISNRAIAASPFDQQITQWVGDAQVLIKDLDPDIDLVFIDAGKKDYNWYYEHLIDKVKQGGFILADNVLWDGKVISHQSDAVTKALQTFNKKVKNDPRVEQMILPLRDGVSIIRKI